MKPVEAMRAQETAEVILTPPERAGQLQPALELAA